MTKNTWEYLKMKTKNREVLQEVINSLEWAKLTIDDRLQFGLPETMAIQIREARVKGVLSEVLKKLRELKNEN
jgi:hypothetical protein